MRRGILVDESGFFVGAVQFEGTVKIPKGMTFLEHPLAIEEADPSKRWDFTPVFETRQDEVTDDTVDPPQTYKQNVSVKLRDGSWLSPPDTLYVVHQRRDLPGVWAYRARAQVFKDRPPPLPERSKYVDGPLPDGVEPSRAFWIDGTGWVLSVRWHIMDGDTVTRTTFVLPGSEPPGVAASDAPAGVSKGWTFDGTDWTAPPPNVPPKLVKAEAERRILEVMPEWRQRNLTAQAVILSEKGRPNWTAAELVAWNAGQAQWEQIDAIRDASDVIEAMTPIPADFADDGYWP